MMEMIWSFAYLVHPLAPFSRFSRVKPVMGAPPSFLGGVHESVIESSDVVTGVGSPQVPGGSEEEKDKFNLNIINLNIIMIMKIK